MLNTEKLKEKYNNLPSGWADHLSEKLGIHISTIRDIKYRSESGTVKFRERGLMIIEQLILLANENEREDSEKPSVSRINRLL